MKLIQLTVIDRTTFEPDNPRRQVFVNPEHIVTMSPGYSIRGEKATGISLPLEGCNAMLFVAETPHQIIDLIEGDEEEELEQSCCVYEVERFVVGHDGKIVAECAPSRR